MSNDRNFEGFSSNFLPKSIVILLIAEIVSPSLDYSLHVEHYCSLVLTKINEHENCFKTIYSCIHAFYLTLTN